MMLVFNEPDLRLLLTAKVTFLRDIFYICTLQSRGRLVVFMDGHCMIAGRGRIYLLDGL